MFKLAAVKADLHFHILFNGLRDFVSGLAYVSPKASVSCNCRRRGHLWRAITVGKRGQCSYRKRDLAVALEVLPPGYTLEVDLRHRKMFITAGPAKAGEENGSDVNPFDREAEKLRKQAEGPH
jgi:hypothetical protein